MSTIHFLKKKKKFILKNLSCKYFLDNTGFFSKDLNFFEKKSIRYKLTGTSKWV